MLHEWQRTRLVIGVGVALFAAWAIALVFAYEAAQIGLERAKGECLARGAKVVEYHTVFGGWACVPR